METIVEDAVAMDDSEEVTLALYRGYHTPIWSTAVEN